MQVINHPVLLPNLGARFNPFTNPLDVELQIPFRQFVVSDNVTAARGYHGRKPPQSVYRINPENQRQYVRLHNVFFPRPSFRHGFTPSYPDWTPFRLMTKLFTPAAQLAQGCKKAAHLVVLCSGLRIDMAQAAIDNIDGESTPKTDNVSPFFRTQGNQMEI